MSLVSVIMPCHNGEAFLADSIRSVVCQTFADWELLVIDDHSSDRSVQIAQSFAAVDRRIRVLHTEICSGTPATPRNVGIAAARGRFIAFLDCDDEWLPTKLARQVPLFAVRDVALVFSYYSKMRADGTLQDRPVASPLVADYRLLLRGDCIGNLTGMYDTHKVGKVYQKEIQHEDYLMWLEVLRSGFYALNTNTCEAFYRVSSRSLSGNKFRMMRWQWHILRHELRLPFLTAASNFCTYAVSGLRKFLR